MDTSSHLYQKLVLTATVRKFAENQSVIVEPAPDPIGGEALDA